MKNKIKYKYTGPIFVNDKLIVRRYTDTVYALDKVHAAKMMKEKIIKNNKLPKKARVFLPAPFIELEMVI